MPEKAQCFEELHREVFDNRHATIVNGHLYGAGTTKWILPIFHEQGA